mgnify:CR=1 FL=1
MVERDVTLVEEVEEPVKAMMPQITRTIRTSDEITQLLEGPVKAAAPNIERIADLATNIAEDIVFMVDGEVIRHQPDGH